MGINILLIFAFLAACATAPTEPPPETPIAASDPVTEVEEESKAEADSQTDDAKLAAEECAETDFASDKDCTDAEKEPIATLCFVTSYDNQIFLKHHIPKAWAQSPCAAKSRILAQICASNLVPSRLGPIQCVPDPSNGECPGAPTICSDEVRPVLCTLSQYRGQPLSWDMALKAWGKNKCDAENKLRTLACQKNLQPSGFKGVVCRRQKELIEDCPPKTTMCSNEYSPRICKILNYEGRKLVPPIAAEGSNLCEATTEAQFLACQRDLRPSRLGEVACESPQ